MTLYLTDLRLPRTARDELPGEGARGVLHVLPHRLAAAAAVTGRLIGETDPDVVIVLSRVMDDQSDRLAVVYRLEAADDVWVPDVLFDHDGDAVSAFAAPPPPAMPSTGDPIALVAPAFGGALAAAIALLGPGRVVGVLSGEASVDRLPEFARGVAERAAAGVLQSRRSRDGGDHVLRSASLAGELADRLRLTVTQRARLLRVARSAAVRAGEIPPPLLSDQTTRPGTKTDAKRRLAELEAALAGTARAEV